MLRLSRVNVFTCISWVTESHRRISQVGLPPVKLEWYPLNYLSVCYLDDRLFHGSSHSVPLRSPPEDGYLYTWRDERVSISCVYSDCACVCVIFPVGVPCSAHTVYLHLFIIIFGGQSKLFGFSLLSFLLSVVFYFPLIFNIILNSALTNILNNT